jgi:nitroreductase
MPEIRAGFGSMVLIGLADLCLGYVKKGFDHNNVHYCHAVKVLNEYREFHSKIGYVLEERVLQKIQSVIEASQIREIAVQLAVNASEYYGIDYSQYKEFFYTRHSIRNFINEEISQDIIEYCIDVALTAPSSCNRQPIRVYAVSNAKQRSEILNIHNGNRGFGHLAPMLLVVCVDLNFMMGFNERNDGYVNAGLFSMNLMHALRMKRIGSCALNWSVTNENDNKLRSILGMKDHEIACLIVACGYQPESFQVALSPRYKAKEIVRYIR